jgi:hypothetical protein
MTQVAALFVDPKGIYPTLVGAEACWGATRDARTYAGPHPVVAHPPCQLWVNMAAVNWKRYGRQRPAWYPGGDDDGCFASALTSVCRYGGVLEHPAGSHAWAHYGLRIPPRIHPRSPLNGWHYAGEGRYRAGYVDRHGNEGTWVCEVWQSAYGHKARKRTWLLYCGKRPPFELRWSRTPGTHQVGWFDRVKPTVGKREASATPEAFARTLIDLAIWSRGAP